MQQQQTKHSDARERREALRGEGGGEREGVEDREREGGGGGREKKKTIECATYRLSTHARPLITHTHTHARAR